MEGISSFDAIFDQFKTGVFNYCFKMTRNSHTAQDIMQEAFLKFFKKYGHTAILDNAQGYIFRIAHNLCIDQLRKEKRMTFLDVLSITDEQVCNTEQTVMNLCGSEEISKYLECLTPIQRSILVLHTVNQLPHAQIAKIHHMSDAAVRKQFQRAKEKIKKHLERKGVVNYETSRLI